MWFYLTTVCYCRLVVINMEENILVVGVHFHKICYIVGFLDKKIPVECHAKRVQFPYLFNDKLLMCSLQKRVYVLWHLFFK